MGPCEAESQEEDAAHAAEDLALVDGNPQHVDDEAANPDEGNADSSYCAGAGEGEAGEAALGGKEEKPEAEVEPPFKLLALLCLVGGLEGADAALLPRVFLALQEDLGLTLGMLAALSIVQGLAGNLAAPFWGIFADRGTLQRRTIIIGGCVLQGLITMLLAGISSMWPMLILRAFNGAFLASLRPIAQGIVADVVVEAHRGKVYGVMGIAMNAGTIVGAMLATNLARKTVVGLQGWRVAFLLVGVASVLVGLVVGACMQEPPRAGKRKAEGSGWRAIVAEVGEVLGYFRLTSFGVLILQGCFGCVPWNALGYSTLFFQLGGVTDFQASLIDVISMVSGSLGGLLGGFIGDQLFRCSPNHGRPLTAQISVLAAIPVAWLLYMQHPPRESAFAYYLLLMVTLGLTATWCQGGVNLPILAKIVKEDRRATIMAWEGALESSFSSIFGNMMVCLLAQEVFGYDLASARNHGAALDRTNARAVGHALMFVSLFPWLLCFACYSLLHWSYPRDIRQLQKQEQEPGPPAACHA